jgi:hypothetical protein|tara:strand:- start:1821 stop:1991 length:171 start_codon:yes stop_codon:yes gene_type:complete
MSLRKFVLVYEAKEMVGLLVRKISSEDLNTLIGSIILKLEIIRKKIEEDREEDEDK